MFPRCPVACTYEDKWFGEVLSLRRKHALDQRVDLDQVPAWMFDLWCEIESGLAERRAAERKAGG